MLVSYAQNFEDVMLWRALGHVKEGFYIDIGAQDPVIDSVSMMFYEHGWRGVHVEPNAYYAQRLRESRPDEIVIQAAVGASSGTLKFYEIPGTGLSTGDEKIAAGHKATDLEVREVIVASVSLKDLFSQCAGNIVHWLKIDVEGFEKQVLDGWRDSPVRPWIVVVESTLPLTTTPSHHRWEATLLQKEYRFAYFDGLNRFYVSKDQVKLLDAFKVGPNIFDDFALSGTSSAPLCSLVNVRAREIEGRAAEEAARKDEAINRAQALREDLVSRERKLETELLAIQREAVRRSDLLAERERAFGKQHEDFEVRRRELETRLQESRQEALRQTSLRADSERMLEAQIQAAQRGLEHSEAREQELKRRLQETQLECSELSRALSGLDRKLTHYRRIVRAVQEQLNTNPPVTGPYKTEVAHAPTVRQLLYFQDRHFVVNAYRTLLRREPDPEGLLHYLDMLRSGRSKLEIIHRIRYCPEGKAVGADVSGIRAGLAIEWLYRAPIVGRWIWAIATSFTLPSAGKERRAFERRLQDELDQLRTRSTRLDRIERLISQSRVHLEVDRTPPIDAGQKAAANTDNIVVLPRPDVF